MNIKQKLTNLLPGDWTSGKEEDSFLTYYYLVFTRDDNGHRENYLFVNEQYTLSASSPCREHFKLENIKNIFDVSSDEIKFINCKIKQFLKMKNFI